MSIKYYLLQVFEQLEIYNQKNLQLGDNKISNIIENQQYQMITILDRLRDELDRLQENFLCSLQKYKNTINYQIQYNQETLNNLQE